METELERMIIRLIGDGTSYQRMLTQAATSTTGTARHIERGTDEASSSWQRAFASVSGYIGPLTALAGVGSAIGSVYKGVRLAATWEENEIAFGTMLGSVERGKQMVRDLQAFAAATPLNTSDLQAAAKTLMQFGTSGDEVMPTLRMLGDVTGGNAQRFGTLALAFGQMQSAGRLMGQDLLQMINAGFNPLQEISRTSGKSMAELKAQMERGGITVDMVKAAFKSATASGGQFAGLMEKQSKSLSGLFSTMQDDIDSSLREIGFAIVDTFMLKDVMQAVSQLAQLFGEFVKSAVEGVKEIGAFLGVTNEHLRAIALSVAIVTFTVLALAGAWYAVKLAIFLAGSTFNTMFGGVGIIIGFLVTAIAAVATAIMAVGGASAAWTKLKQLASDAWAYIKIVALAFWRLIKPAVDEGIKFIVAGWNIIKTVAVTVWGWITAAAMRFWNWIRPAVVAGILFIGTMWNIVSRIARETWERVKFYAQVAWEVIKEGARIAWDGVVYLFNLGRNFIAQVWQDIGGNTEITWVSIVDMIQHAFIAAEFVAMNFGRLMDYMWLTLRLGAAIALNYVMKGFPETSRVVVAVIYAIGEAWDAFINNMMYLAEIGWNFLKAGWAGVQYATAAALRGDNPLTAFQEGFEGTLRDLQGRTRYQYRGIGQAAERGFRDGMQLIDIDARALGLDEEALYAEWLQMGENLAQDFAEFRDRRILDIANFQFPGIAQAQAMGETFGGAVGTGVNEGMGKEVKKLEATNLFGADSLAKVEEQLRKINSGAQPRAGRNRNDAADARSAEGVALMRRQLAVQERIANRPPVVFQPAGL